MYCSSGDYVYRYSKISWGIMYLCMQYMYVPPICLTTTSAIDDFIFLRTCGVCGMQECCNPSGTPKMQRIYLIIIY